MTCCLNYELDAYMDALKEFPSTNTKLKTEKGNAFFQKMDIFKATMTYSFVEEPSHFIEIPLQRVHEILNENKKGNKVADLIIGGEKTKSDKEHFKNVVGQASLTRFDRSQRPKKKKKRKFKKNNEKK